MGDPVSILLERFDKARAGKRKPRTRSGYQFHVRMSDEYAALLRLAAKERNISVGGYIRRAVAKQVAKDLDMPWEGLLSTVPHPAEYGKTISPRREQMDIGDGRIGWMPLPDDGTGYGDWT